MSNRGVKVWPGGHAETFCSDHCAAVSCPLPIVPALHINKSYPCFGACPSRALILLKPRTFITLMANEGTAGPGGVDADCRLPIAIVDLGIADCGLGLKIKCEES